MRTSDFAADEELVGHHVPRADQDAAVLDRLAQPRFLLRPDLEVVLEHDGLAVEMEMLVVGIGVEQIEQPIDERDEPEPELLVRQIPFAIPVRVRDDMDGQHIYRSWFVVLSSSFVVSSFVNAERRTPNVEPERRTPNHERRTTGFYPLTAPAVRPATK